LCIIPRGGTRVETFTEGWNAQTGNEEKKSFQLMNFEAQERKKNVPGGPSTSIYSNNTGGSTKCQLMENALLARCAEEQISKSLKMIIHSLNFDVYCSIAEQKVH
jgi:hypothetical protein